MNKEIVTFGDIEVEKTKFTNNSGKWGYLGIR